jgi:DNA-binding response OmpR family regulator
MVVDDDPVSLEVARARLESRGYEVVTRDRAFGTTAAILRERPDVVLLDINMPGLPGDDLLRAITTRDLLPPEQRTAFILHSGEDAETLRRHVDETGALGGIEKTADHGAFLASFEALLRRFQKPEP